MFFLLLSCTIGISGEDPVADSVTANAPWPIIVQKALWETSPTDSAFGEALLVLSSEVVDCDDLSSSSAIRDGQASITNQVSGEFFATYWKGDFAASNCGSSLSGSDEADTGDATDTSRR